MTKKPLLYAVTVCVVSCLLSVCVSLFICSNAVGHKAEERNTDVQYVLYLGTNDKDTNTPVFPPEEAKSRAQDILLKYFGGYTIQEANGGWVDGDTVYREYTLVIYLTDTTLEQVHEVCNEFIREFNQSSVLIRSNSAATEFYSGN